MKHPKPGSAETNDTTIHLKPQNQMKPQSQWNLNIFDTTKLMKPQNPWNQETHESTKFVNHETHENYETTKPLKPRNPWNLRNCETFDTTKPMKPQNPWNHETN